MAVPVSSPSSLSFPLYSQPHKHHSHSISLTTHNLSFSSTLNLTFHYHSPLQATRRTASSSNFPQDGIGDLTEGTRKWARSIDSIYNDDDEDEEEEDRSLDLLVRFLQNVFRKISKRAKKAVRSVLPNSISSKLGHKDCSSMKTSFQLMQVGFSVNGVLVLAFLWVLKAFLEVLCTLGSVVFVSILLFRGIWTGVMYLQDSRLSKLNGYDDDSHIWTGTRPAT